jgi:hypothetical protein
MKFLKYVGDHEAVEIEKIEFKQGDVLAVSDALYDMALEFHSASFVHAEDPNEPSKKDPVIAPESVKPGQTFSTLAAPVGK